MVYLEVVVMATAVVVAADGKKLASAGMQVDATALVVQLSITCAEKPAIGVTVAVVDEP
jgi:hypothetical protein